jgi:hypothetical protein
MTRARKLLLVLVGLILLSQIPFVYRRFRLRRLNNAIQSIKTSTVADGLVEYQGVIHVHSFLGGHSSGTFQEIISAARANHLNFVIMTEHAEKEIDTAAMTLQGLHDGILFVNGNEVSSASGDRLLTIPGDSSSAGADKISTAELATNARARKALSIIAYPNEFKSWGNDFEGIEVYNVFTNAKEYNRLVAFFDALWAYSSYRDLLFTNFYQRPTDALKRWDLLSANGKLVATAGNDSHSNIGASINDSSGKQLVGIKLDPYSTSFHLVRMHVLLPRDQSLDSTTLLEAIRAGHCYIGFEVLGDPSGFRFSATNGVTTATQGDELPLQPGTVLKIRTPVKARLLVLKNGEVQIDESDVQEKEIQINDRGVYRVEVYLPQLGKPVGDQPWIISNPIYVR